MINIKEHSRQLMTVLKTTGFNGIRLSFEDETTDLPEEGEQTVEEKAEWDRNYAIFTVEPRFPTVFKEDEKPYVVNKLYVDEDRFWNDFQNMLQSYFGNDVEIKFYKGCREFEIMRKK